jgi:hypothetical protein
LTCASTWRAIPPLKYGGASRCPPAAWPSDPGQPHGDR